jgi:glucose/arabinose dehydrogenase
MRRAAICLVILAGAGAACSSGSSPPPPDSCSAVPASALVDAWTADPHYCMIRFASNVTAARELAVAPNGDIFVAGNGQVVVLFDSNGDGVSDDTERTTFATIPAGNHGLALTATHVYASNTTTVVRWPYASGDRVATGPMEAVVSGFATAGHDTRTLLVDAKNRLYVNVGSSSNIDAPADPTTPPATRALIHRYDLASIPADGYAAEDGEVFAYGLRNEVGLSIDSKGRMWGVENGVDRLAVVTGDIHYDNPAEEVNLFDTERPGRNYGYPFCFSEGIWMDPMAKGPGTQHADVYTQMVYMGAFTEAMCQDTKLIVPPAFALGAHLAPLSIVEYQGNGYPAELRGDMFVASHGSWNRESGQVGRTIIRLKMGAAGPTAAQNFLGESDGAGGMLQGTWALRPVSLRVDHAGLLTFFDDVVGTVNKIGYKP